MRRSTEAVLSAAARTNNVCLISGLGQVGANAPLLIPVYGFTSNEDGPDSNLVTISTNGNNMDVL